LPPGGKGRQQYVCHADPQHWCLSILGPLNYVAKHDSNTIIKFADDTTVVGLITDNDETAYREEVRDLAVWCQDNNLYLLLILKIYIFYFTFI
jgi:hypothetical protein